MASKVSALDRFIPARAFVDFDHAYDKLTEEQPDGEAPFEMNVSLLCKNHRRLELRRRLDKIARINEGILNISPFSRSDKTHPSTIRLWPCHPRRKPVIRNEKIFDLPEFNCGFHLNPIDWGTNDWLAASVGNKVLIGKGFDNLQVYKETMLEYDSDRATAVNWSPDGMNLALGSETGLMLVWVILKKKLVMEEKCCFRRRCTITSIRWHPGNMIFAWGCARGKLSIRSLNNRVINNVERAHKGYICSLRYSPRGDYLCSSGQDAYLRIWKGTNCSPYMEIEMGNPSRAIAWHPWRTGILAVGEGPPGSGSLSLWNVNTAKLLFMKKMPQSTAITALDFNEITGELVFSQSVDGDWVQGDEHSEIIILGGPQYVVDFITKISGSVFALIWSADNTKLGAASSDETFRIWNFHQPVKCKRPRSKPDEDLNFLALKKFKSFIR